jgi:hypothetical protein
VQLAGDQEVRSDRWQCEVVQEIDLGWCEDMGTLVNTASGMVIAREILADISPDILSGLGMSAAVSHDVERHLTVLAVIGGPIHTPVVIPTRPTKG